MVEWWSGGRDVGVEKEREKEEKMGEKMEILLTDANFDVMNFVCNNPPPDDTGTGFSSFLYFLVLHLPMSLIPLSIILFLPLLLLFLRSYVL